VRPVSPSRILGKGSIMSTLLLSRCPDLEKRSGSCTATSSTWLSAGAGFRARTTFREPVQQSLNPAIADVVESLSYRSNCTCRTIPRKILPVVRLVPAAGRGSTPTGLREFKALPGPARLAAHFRPPQRGATGRPSTRWSYAGEWNLPHDSHLGMLAYRWCRSIHLAELPQTSGSACRNRAATGLES